MNANWGFFNFFSPIVRKNCLKYVYAINVNYYQCVKKIVQTIANCFFLNSVEVENTNKKKKLYINKRLVIVTQDKFICMQLKLFVILIAC